MADSRKRVREREKRENDGDIKVLCDLKPMVYNETETHSHKQTHTQALCPLRQQRHYPRDAEKSSEEDALSLSLTHTH